MSFWKHFKNYLAIVSRCTKCSIENGASTVCSCILQGVHQLFIFLPPKINQLLKFNRELCLAYSNCMSIQMIRWWHEHPSLGILTAVLFWLIKKRIPTCSSSGSTTRNDSSIFNSVIYTFLWSDYSVVRNSKIILPWNFTSIGSQNAERKK